MLGIDIRSARAAWTVFLMALALATIYFIRHTLMVFALAMFFAYMLSPVVNLVERFTPRRRNLSLAIVYVLLIGALIAGGVFLGSLIAEQASNLISKLPDLVKQDKWTKWPLPGWLNPARDRIVEAVRGEFANAGKDFVPFLKRAGGEIFAAAGNMVEFILVPILAFFILKDAKEIREGFVESVEDGHHKSLLENILLDIHTLLGQYIRALVILASATFVTYTIFMQAAQVPYALLLAGIAAVLEFIPVVGPATAGAIIVLVSAISGYPHLLWIVIFWVVYRLFQDYVLLPNLMGQGVELHPLLVLFGVLAGEQIGGIPGMFFSVPVIATLRVIYVRAKRERHRRPLVPKTR